MYAKATALPTEHRTPFYNDCCGLETFLGHTKNCLNAPPAANRYRSVKPSNLEADKTILICRGCGSFVADHRTHDDFHDSKETR